MYSFTTYNSRVDDVLKALGIPSTQAKDHIWKSFADKYFSFPSNTNIKTYPQNKRVAAVLKLGSYVRNYLFSPDFMRQYQLLREEKRPKVPLSIQERVKIQIEEFSQLLKESEKASKKAGPELRSIYENSIKQYKQRISALENDYDPQHPKEMEGILIQHEYDTDDYRFRIKQFEREYPEDLKAFIRMRLQHFLQVTATIDFNADVVELSGKKKFVNQTYEAKPPVWKYCFRAGKGVTSAARSLAEQWLKEI